MAEGGPMRIRWMIRRDMPEVLDIERRCYRAEAWTEDVFHSYLRNRFTIGMVCENDESRVVGFMVYDLRKTSMYLHSMVVHPEEQRCGIGRCMMEKLFSKLNERRPKLRAIVPADQLVAQLFLKAMGLRATHSGEDDQGRELYEFQYRKVETNA